MRFRTAFPTALLLGSLLGAGLAAAGSPKYQLRLFSSAPPIPDIPESVVPVVEAVTWDLPITWHESVERFVNLFGQRQTDRMALYLKRSGRYEGMIRSKLRERGMPEDLLYLSMIESGFNPNARSPAQAVGLWQFIAATGRRYGLRIDSYVDERRDPEKSTDAALSYLSDLHQRFGSWYLAAAAYNTGENRVSRIMREETGAERGVEADFWRIRHRLPRETREYVPLIVAAALVGKEPEKYGLDHVERWLPIPTGTVDVPGGTDLAVVAAAIEATPQQLRALNPHLIRGVTPPDGSFGVRIPSERIELFAVNFPRVQAEARARASTPQPTRVAANPATRASAPARASAQSRTSRPASAARSPHTVKKGESLHTIARRHGTSVAALQRANGMGKRTVIQPGQRLRIPG